MLRAGLISYRQSAYTGKQLSWKAITDEINESQGCNLNSKYLSKFAEGLPHRNPELKAQGMREYQDSIQGGGLEYVLAFLSDADNDQPFVDRGLFELQKGTVLWPQSLAEFFNAEGTQTHALQIGLLAGIYQLSYYGNSDTFLQLKCAAFENALEFRLFPKTAIVNRLQEIDAYAIGWAIATPEDNLMFLGREVTREEDAIGFTTLAFDNRLRQGKAPQRLVLRKIESPIDYEILEADGSISKELIDDLASQESALIWQCTLKYLEYEKEEC